jgi:hypothetical protein
VKTLSEISAKRYRLRFDPFNVILIYIPLQCGI